MKILIAEHDEFTRLLMVEVVRSLGHEPFVARDGEEALAAFAREAPSMLVLDWQIPPPDGLEVCRRVRQADCGSDAYVLIVTSRDGSDDLAAVLDAGADDYAAKPISLDGLRARLVIAQRRIAKDDVRRRTEEALARARWLAGIGEMSLAIQHEVNNPLAALLGNAALVETGLCDEAEARQCMRVMVEQAQRIAGVVKRLTALKDPRSVEYLRGARMIDLSPGAPKSAGEA